MATPVSEDREKALLTYSRWALLATVAALPLYVVRWHYGPLPTTLLETLIIITVLLYVVARWRDGRRRPLATPYDIPIIALLVAGAIAVLVANDHRTALGLYRAFFVEAIAIFYVAIDLLGSPDHVRRLFLAFAVGSSLFALLNLAAFAQAFVNHQVQVGSAPNALYGDANYVAMYLEPPVALATALILFGGGRLRWIGIAWLTVTGLALLLTFSKAAYLALVVLGLIAVLNARRWRWPLLAALVVLGVLVSRIPLIAERIATTRDSLFGRFDIYVATVRMLREHPFFGLGLGGYNYVYRHFSPEPYPHDIWLTFWVELGLLGLVAFAVILFGLLWRGRRAWPRVEGFDRIALWGVLVAFLLWTVHGLVDSPYWKNDMSVEFWALAAVEVAVIARLARKASGEPTPATAPRAG